jgi:leader peptidase (prepilin peptidase) / N-methyltransferase
LAIISLFLLCWGSFLNVIGYRLIHFQSIIFHGSACPKCKHPLAWYDNVPIISYIILYGKCRYCTKTISWLYPFIEILTLLVMLALFSRVESPYWFAYFIFFSALIVTIRSDLESMLISRFVTIFLIPLGYLCATLSLLPIPLSQSIVGSIFGYLVLLGAVALFAWITGKQGMGQGDLELLAFIGAFTGPWGCWITLMLASTIGALCGIAYIIFSKKRSSIKIPFGPFLAVGALLFVLYQDFFTSMFFQNL